MVLSKEHETKGIGAMLIIEVIGKPPEHLTDTLNDLIRQIDEEKGVSVKEKTLHEPILMKDQKDFYTSFAEVEVEVEEISHLAVLMFKFMPAHVEIIYPEFIALTNNGWTDIFSELTRRLHGYDEIARVLDVEKRILEKKLREVLEREREFKNSVNDKKENLENKEETKKKSKKKKN